MANNDKITPQITNNRCKTTHKTQITPEVQTTSKTQITPEVQEAPNTRITNNKVAQKQIHTLTQELLYRTPLKDRKHSTNERINLAFKKYDECVRSCIDEGDSVLYDAANELVQVTSEVYLEQGLKEGLLLMSDALNYFPEAVSTTDFSNYISMYHVLFHGISHAISMLEENSDCCMKDVIAYLRQAQEESLDIYV